MGKSYSGAVRPRALIALVLVALLAAAPAAAAPPADLSDDPLDRAVLLALPSIYRVEVTIRVEALRLSDGTRRPVTPRARTITEFGTAVAVGDGGWLVTAAHVAAPDPATIARLAYQNDLAFRGDAAHTDEAAASQWVADNRARAVGPGVVDVEVTQADPGTSTPRRTFEMLTARRAGTADLALIRIDAATAPVLGLEEGRSTGTPVATIGFGTGSALAGDAEARRGDLEPALRRGRIVRTGVLENEDPPREALLVSAPVERGDSGGPVIDSDGRVRGIVTRRRPEGGVAEMATEVRLLLASAGAAPGENGSAESFRTAMQAFWRLDFAEAERGFDATLRDFSSHTLAAHESTRAEALAAGRYRLGGDRRRDLLLAIGFVAAVVAAACALALVRPALPDRGGGGGGR